MPKTTIYLPEDLAEAARARNLNVSALTQGAIRAEIQRSDAVANYPRISAWLQRVTTLNVDTQAWEDGPDVATEFQGAWVIDPEDDVRSGEFGAPAGVKYAFAVTGRGRFVAFSAHVNDGGGQLRDFDDLDEALDVLPEDVADIVRGQLSGRRVLDI